MWAPTDLTTINYNFLIILSDVSYIYSFVIKISNKWPKYTSSNVS